MALFVLYRFTYSDTQSQSQSELNFRITEFLQQEAKLQGWTGGFQLRQYQSPEKLPNGGTQYFFEVIAE